MPKAVYLLFLRHPEGIRLKELYHYRDELTDIYERLTSRSERDEVRETIRNLTDSTQPLISQKCSRIRQAFRRLMDEDTVRWYYIAGANGEPKKIALPRGLLAAAQ